MELAELRIGKPDMTTNKWPWRACIIKDRLEWYTIHKHISSSTKTFKERCHIINDTVIFTNFMMRPEIQLTRCEVYYK